MQYAEVIGTISPGGLRKIASNLGLPARPRDKKETERLLKELLGFYQDPPRLSRLLASLSQEEKLALKLISLVSNSASLPSQQAERRLGNMLLSQDRAHQSLKRLVELGLVFYLPGSGWFGDGHYAVPIEAINGILNLALEELSRNLVLEPQTEPQAASGPVAVRDIYALLAGTLIYQFRVTSEGAIHRQDLKKVQSYLPGYPQEYLSLLAEIAGQLGLFENKAGRAVPSIKAWDWIKIPLRQQFAEILSAATGIYPQSVETPANAVLSIFLINLPESSFLPLAEVVTFLQSSQDTPEAKNKVAAELSRGVDVFQRLGYLQQISTTRGPAVRIAPVWRCLPREDQSSSCQVETFTVQPNFEVIASQELRPEVFWQLCQCADLVKVDRAITCRLTRSSLYRSWWTGLKLEDVKGFLQHHSKYPLSQNVLASLDDWSRQIGRMYMLQAAVLRCDSPELAAELKSLKAVSPYVVGQITPRDLLIRSEAAQLVLTGLKKAGYFPHPETFTALPKAAAAAPDSDDGERVSPVRRRKCSQAPARE